jgi:hypothetical protein
MTKAELLTDLANKSYVKELIGEASADTTPPGDLALGIKWYRQNYFEVVQNIAIKRDITFYVVNEGEDTEWAAYQNAGPDVHVNTNNIKQWFDNKWLAKVLDPADPTLNWRVCTTGKEQHAAIVCVLELSEGKGIPKGYYSYQDQNGDMQVIEIDITKEDVVNIMMKKM